MDTPVLFLVFNRPSQTRRVFAEIRKARPQRLYLAADGPRASRPAEAALCAEVRAIAREVDWPCEVRTLFRDKNLGCGQAVSSAISWFFENEPEGIILEDDCLPDQSFFRFAGELLARFRDEDSIMSIGSQYRAGPGQGVDGSYFLSRYQVCWGWASWRRAWGHYDFNLVEWPRLRDSGWLESISDGDPGFAAYWREMFDRIHAGQIDTWDYQWLYSCWLREGLAVMPATTVVANIGFGPDATHTLAPEERDMGGLGEMIFPLRHPGLVRNVAADRSIQRVHFNRPWFRAPAWAVQFKRWLWQLF